MRPPTLPVTTLRGRVEDYSRRDGIADSYWKKPQAKHSDAKELQFRSLLVPLDGSRAAEHAVPWALKFARRSGGMSNSSMFIRPGQRRR